MTSCPITGSALITKHRGQIRWEQADPEIHVTLKGHTEAVLLLTKRYEIGEPCPRRPEQRHARLRPTTQETRP
jgi:hypothetical protein